MQYVQFIEMISLVAKELIDGEPVIFWLIFLTCSYSIEMENFERRKMFFFSFLNYNSYNSLHVSEKKTFACCYRHLIFKSFSHATRMPSELKLFVGKAL